MKNLRSNSLALVLLGGGGAALLLWLATGSALAALVAGLLIVLVLPGYALTEALFAQHHLGWAERLLLVVGSSLALTALGSLALYQLGWSLQMNSWLGLLIVVTGVGAVGAWGIRGTNEPAAPMPVQLGFSLTHLVLIGLAVLLTGMAFATAGSPAPAQGYQGYTMLWMTPQQAGAPNRIELGVQSKEFAPTQYRLQLKVNDQLAQEWPALELGPNGLWQASFELPAEQLAQSDISADLYRLDQPEMLYRHVVLRAALN
jgi:Protein of unknown function (DUF1616)